MSDQVLYVTFTIAGVTHTVTLPAGLLAADALDYQATTFARELINAIADEAVKSIAVTSGAAATRARAEEAT